MACGWRSYRSSLATSIRPALSKTRVDGAQLMRAGVEPLLYAQQQDLAELRDGLGRPVVAAHQRLAGAHGQALAVGAVER